MTLSDRHYGVTPTISEYLCEAARVCLARHHRPPTDVAVHDDDRVLLARLAWRLPDVRCKDAWANEIDATEAAACGCALAVIETVRGLVAMQRAEILTGADYYVVPVDDPKDDLENALRLEVSGVDHGGRSEVRSRLRSKLDQLARGNGNLPALAVIVGFKERLILIRDLEP